MHLPYLKARIRRHPNTQYWQAVFYAWDQAAQKWTRCLKSTKTTNKTKAASIAQELQTFALRAQEGADTSISRDYVLDTLNHILRLAGREYVTPSKPWDEYSAVWLELRKPRTGARTMLNYKGHVKSLTSWLGKRASTDIATLTAQDIQAWYNHLIAEGRTPATADCSLKIIKQIFNRAQAEGFCQRNPADLVVRQHGESNVREPFTIEEIAQILSYLRDTGQKDWLTVTLLGICTGQRLRDCALADWSQITEHNNTLVWTLKQAKTGAQVIIPIVEPLATTLLAVPKAERSGALAPSLAEPAKHKRTDLSTPFSAILDKAGITRTTQNKKDGAKGQKWTNKTYHSLRHTTNSLMANAGISDDVRRKILGHASTAMNARYTHLDVSTTMPALQQALGGLTDR